METILIECIHSSLRLFLNRNAIFMCERLYAEFPSELNLQLLASCYLRNNQAYCAYHILKGTQMAQSRYLFALSCFQMDLLHEAEMALCPASETNAEVPNGAAGHYLLGLVYRYMDRRKSAIDHFTKALLIDPFLWSAYEELCHLGAAEEPNVFFGDEAIARLSQKLLLSVSSSHIEADNESSGRTLSSEDGNPRQLKQLHGNSHKESFSHSFCSVMGLGQANHFSNCGPSMHSCDTPSPMLYQHVSGIAPPVLCRNGQSNLCIGGGEGSPRNSVGRAPRRKFMDEGKLRKVSGRLFSDSAPRRSTRLAGETATVNASASMIQVGGSGSNHVSSRLVGGFCSSKMSSMTSRSITFRRGHGWAAESLDEGRHPEESDESHLDIASVSSALLPTTSHERPTEREKGNLQLGISYSSLQITIGIEELLGLLRILGEGYRLSCLYRCQDAVEAYLKLSPQQYNTGWVLSQVGRAYFELVDYHEADNNFRSARRVSPYALDGMDIYSTVLYHLKEEMKLSYLAHDLLLTDRLSPQAWCAVGNCYSLQKDHEAALRTFQRAIHLDSKLAYAHTLCGHEHVALEDFGSGIKCYQSALRVDPRHYNAWYGLGMVYFRQDRFEFAEHHFRKAFQINSRSSVLMCYLGMALHSLKRNDESLVLIEKAIVADKKNPLPMFQKGSILLSLARFEDALKVLEQLKEYVPRESSVWALMGKIYKRIGMHDKAMFHYGHALDLKPSAADVATIKSDMEKLNVPDELEEL